MHIVAPRDLPFATHSMIVAGSLGVSGQNMDSHLLLAGGHTLQSIDTDENKSPQVSSCFAPPRRTPSALRCVMRTPACKRRRAVSPKTALICFDVLEVQSKGFLLLWLCSFHSISIKQKVCLDLQMAGLSNLPGMLPCGGQGGVTVCASGLLPGETVAMHASLPRSRCGSEYAFLSCFSRRATNCTSPEGWRSS